MRGMRGGVSGRAFLPRRPSRTLPRNLKKGGLPQPECRVRLSHPPTSATGHLAAAHFRGRQNGKVHAQPGGRVLFPRPLPRPATSRPLTSAGGKTGKFMHSRKCEISRLLGFNRTPLREQVGMKNCRTSTRKPYTIRRGAISAIEKRDFPWETRTGAFPYLRNPGLQRINGNAENFPLLPYPFVPVFRSSPKMPLKSPHQSPRTAPLCTKPPEKPETAPPPPLPPAAPDGKAAFP